MLRHPLSLHLIAAFVCVFIAAALAFAYSFDLARTQAPEVREHEHLGVARTADRTRATPPDVPQQHGNLGRLEATPRMESESVYLSRIELNQKPGQIRVPHPPTLRAASPVHDPAGNLFGLVVVDMDEGRVSALVDATLSVYIADVQGALLLHPQPGGTFAVDLRTPMRTELETKVRQRAGLPQRQVLLGMAALLALAVTLVILTAWWLTRLLAALANAAELIAAGDYQVTLPAARGETGRLVEAFRRMAAALERREQALLEVNRGLERLVAERTAELGQQHALQQLILANIADGVVVTDSVGRFLLWNEKAVEIIGSGPDAVPIELWSAHFGIFRDESLEPVPTDELPMARAIRGESSDSPELYLRNPKSNEGRWVQVTARPLLARDGGLGGAVAVLVDMSEQKRLRQRVESSRAELAEFGRLAMGAGVVSSATHQLSQPLTAISNYTGAAVRLHQQGRLGEAELLDLLTRMETLSKRAGKILDKLRALIRPRNLTPGPLDVSEVADACLDFLGPRIRQQGVRVQRCYGQDLPKPRGDPVEMTHVLIQLVSNALDAMDSPAVVDRRLSISTGYDPDKGLIRIQVDDTGPGLSPEQVEHLFQPWQTDKPDALGIGLFVAQTIVEMHMGTICRDDSQGIGGHFRIELPTG